MWLGNVKASTRLTIQFGLIIIYFPICRQAQPDFLYGQPFWVVLLSLESEGLGREWLKGLFQFLLSHQNDGVFSGWVEVVYQFTPKSPANSQLEIRCKFEFTFWFSGTAAITTFPTTHETGNNICTHAKQNSTNVMWFTYQDHSRHQRPRYFWPAPRIATSGRVRLFEHA